jgi:peroxiredoxin
LHEISSQPWEGKAMSTGGPLLSERLQAFHQAMLARMGPCDAEAWHRGEAQMAASEITAGVLRVGGAAPDFCLPDQHGAEVCLADRLALGPVVLIFFRGGWCPHCTLTLRAWQDALPELHDAGGDLLAISPQQLRDCTQTAERDLLAYPVLSDRGHLVAEGYGLAYELPEVLRPLYARLGHDLPRINGTGDWRLLLSATFVIGQDKRVASAHAGTLIWQRLEPRDAIAAVRALAG